MRLKFHTIDDFGELDERRSGGFMHGRLDVIVNEAAVDHPFLEWSLNWRASLAGATFQADAVERTVSVRLCFGPVFVALVSPAASVLEAVGVGGPEYGDVTRELGLTLEDIFTLRWMLWMSPWEYRSSDPFWRRGSFNLLDAVFGRERVSSETSSQLWEVTVPMPERSYKGIVHEETVTVSRSRWPFKFGPKALFHRYKRLDIRMNDGDCIPIPGKGENSWDCDDDAIYGMNSPGSDLVRFVSDLVHSALSTRRKRASLDWTPPAATPPEAA